MTLKLAEGAVTALNTYLSSNFAAEVAALNTEYGDAIVLTAPSQYAISEIVEADAYPTIEVLCDSTSIHGIAAGYIGTTHDITIVCTVMDDTDTGVTKTHLRQRVYRYARCIVELLRAAQAASGFSDGATPPCYYGIQLRSDPLVDFSPAIRRRGTSMIMAACGVRVQLQIEEAG